MIETPGYYVHPVRRFVRSLDGQFYLRQEVAAALNRSVDAIRYATQRRPELNLGPSYSVTYGKMHLSLYTQDDLTALAAYFTRPLPRLTRSRRKRKPAGRPRLWTPDEVHERGLRARQADYHARRGHEARAERIRAELRAERDARLSSTRK